MAKTFDEEIFSDGICAKDSDCPDGQVCDNGICTFEDGICAKDSDCPDGQVCDNGIICMFEYGIAPKTPIAQMVRYAIMEYACLKTGYAQRTPIAQMVRYAIMEYAYLQQPDAEG